MKRIYKYNLLVSDSQMVSLPLDSEILSVQMQGDSLMMWCLVDTNKASEQIIINIFGTGNPIDNDFKGLFIDTFQMNGGSLVFHVFKQI